MEGGREEHVRVGVVELNMWYCEWNVKGIKTGLSRYLSLILI